MTRYLVSAACGLWLCAAQGVLQGAGAQTATQSATQSAAHPVVVELYTSQGCSSCPPADALLAELAKEPGVIPLALHVDYWDYIGWTDEFARPGFTKRQKSYAKAAGERMIYTPQMIVGGVERVVGHEPKAVAAAIAAAAARPSPVALTVTEAGGQLVIRAEARGPLEAPLSVQLVGYQPGVKVDIDRGENAGLAVEYRNIVGSWERLGEWSGQTPLELRAPRPAEEKGVVILQREGPAEIVAAAALP
jgi:hypothetical protein